MASRSVVRAQVRTRSNTPAMCQYHQNQKAILVCVRPECDQAFACVKCVGTNHRGHELEDITDYATKKKQSLLAKLKTGKENILVVLRQQIKSTEEKLSSNRDKSRDVQEKVLERCQSLKKILDTVAAKYGNICKSKEKENELKLSKYKESLDEIVESLIVEFGGLEDIIEKGSESDLILADKATTFTSPDTSNAPKTGDLQFKFKNIPYNIVEEWFGDLASVKDVVDVDVVVPKTASPSDRNVTTSSSMKIQYISEFILQSDTEFMCDILYPLEEEIYIWFWKSNYISLVSKSGNVKQTTNLNLGLVDGDYIRDLYISPVDNTFWCLSDKNCIQQLKPDGTKLTSFKMADTCYSLCATRGQSLAFGLRGQVQICTTSGKKIRTLRTSDLGLNDTGCYIVQCRKTGRFAIRNTVTVSVVDENWNFLYASDGVVVQTKGGTMRITGYKPGKSFKPTQMFFDDEGKLLVIDDNNFNLIMFNEKGDYICSVIQEPTRDKRPLNANAYGDKLWVALDLGVFKQFKYK